MIQHFGIKRSDIIAAKPLRLHTNNLSKQKTRQWLLLKVTSQHLCVAILKQRAMNCQLHKNRKPLLKTKKLSPSSEKEIIIINALKLSKNCEVLVFISDTREMKTSYLITPYKVSCEVYLSEFYPFLK